MCSVSSATAAATGCAASVRPWAKAPCLRLPARSVSWMASVSSRPEIGWEGPHKTLAPAHKSGWGPVGFAAEHPSGAAETGDDFVDDEKNVVFLQDRLHALEVTGRWHDHAARAAHRLRNEGGHGFGAFLEDQLLQVVGDALRERWLGFARQAEVIVTRAVGVQHAGQRQVEIAVHMRQTREAARGHRHTV